MEESIFIVAILLADRGVLGHLRVSFSLLLLNEAFDAAKEQFLHHVSIKEPRFRSRLKCHLFGHFFVVDA